MMVEISITSILTVVMPFFIVVLLVLLFTLLDLREDKKQLQWDANYWHESYREYHSKYIDVNRELRKLKEKKE